MWLTCITDALGNSQQTSLNSVFSGHHRVRMEDRTVSQNIPTVTSGQIHVHTESNIVENLLVCLSVGDSWVHSCKLLASTAYEVLPDRPSPPAVGKSDPSGTILAPSFSPLCTWRTEGKRKDWSKHKGVFPFSRPTFINEREGPDHQQMDMESLHTPKSNVRCVSQTFKMCTS